MVVGISLFKFGVGMGINVLTRDGYGRVWVLGDAAPSRSVYRIYNFV